jgi:hypothetical protein
VGGFLEPKMAKGKVGPGIVISNRMNSAKAGTKGLMASINPPAPKALGPTPSAPTKVAPKTSPTSAIAPKVQGAPGAAAKNPAANLGGGRKLGNHF